MQWCELFGLNSISAQSERPAEAAWRMAADAGRGVAARSRSRHTADMFSKAVLDHVQNPRGANLFVACAENYANESNPGMLRGLEKMREKRFSAKLN